MFKAIFTEVRKINIFGRDLQLEKDFSNKFNSVSSFILSLLVFISTIVVGFVIGQEIYQKERPKVTSNPLKIDVESSQINFAEFPAIIGFTDKMGMPLSISQMKKTIQLIVSITKIDSNGITQTYSELEECNVENISNIEVKKIVTERLKILSAYKQFCFDPKLAIKNKLGTPNSLSVGLLIQRCKSDCYENLSERIDGMFGGVAIVNSFIDPSNFNNPIVFYEMANSFILNSKISEQIIYSYSRNVLNSNIGWIFDEYEKKTFISFKETIKSYYFSDYEISRIILDSPLVVTQLTRDYMKIQELLASVGGFFNAAYLILSLFFGNYIKFDYYCYVDEKTKYIDEDNRNPSKNIDLKTNNKVKLNNYINLKKKNAHNNEDHDINSNKDQNNRKP